MAPSPADAADRCAPSSRRAYRRSRRIPPSRRAPARRAAPRPTRGSRPSPERAATPDCRHARSPRPPLARVSAKAASTQGAHRLAWRSRGPRPPGASAVAERQPVAAAPLQADRADDTVRRRERRQHQRQVAAERVGLARGVDEAARRRPWDRGAGCARCSARLPISSSSARWRRASARRGQRSHSRRVSSRKTSSLAISGNMIAPLGWLESKIRAETKKGMRSASPFRRLRACRTVSQVCLLGNPRPSAGIKRRGGSRGSRRYSAACLATTDTYCRVCFCSKTTAPAAVAKSVWSTPMPTLRPA